MEQIVTKLVAFLVQIYRDHLGLLRVFTVRCVSDKSFAERGMKLRGYIEEKLAAGSYGSISGKSASRSHVLPSSSACGAIGSTLDNL